MPPKHWTELTSEDMEKKDPIVGHYEFKVTEDDGWYLATLKFDGVQVGFTQGKTPEQLFDMVADAYLTVHEIPVSWWNRLLFKLIKY